MLKDKEYSKIVKDTINEVLSLHVKETNSNNNNDNDDYDNKKFIINDQLLLETILMMIRGETIKYIVHIEKESRLKKKNNWKKKL